MGKFHRSHPVGYSGQIEAAPSSLRPIATRFCLCQQSLKKLDGWREITAMKPEVVDADATCYRLQTHASQAMCHLQGLLRICNTFIELSHRDREEEGQIKEYLHCCCTEAIATQDQCVLQCCIGRCSLLLSP